MNRTAMIIRFVAAAGLLAASDSLALAACGDPPAPPIKLRIEAHKIRKDLDPATTALTLHWENRASESRVCFWVEIRGPNGFQRVDQSLCGGWGKGWPMALPFHKLKPDTTYCFRAHAWTGSLGGDCRSPWSGTVCGKTDAGDTNVCRRYASEAVGAIKLARDSYKCDPQTITGPRWSANEDEHFQWCLRSTAAARQAEAAARADIMNRCRVNKPTGHLRIHVIQRHRPDPFTVIGTGFPVNSGVVIRLSGDAAATGSITQVDGKPIIASANGTFSVRIPRTTVCKSAGRVLFIAQDRDGERRSNPVSMPCPPI